MLPGAAAGKRRMYGGRRRSCLIRNGFCIENAVREPASRNRSFAAILYNYM